jgi:hypothetical protein
MDMGMGSHSIILSLLSWLLSTHNASMLGAKSNWIHFIVLIHPSRSIYHVDIH